ncbi:MAG: hypothetical protein KIT79_15300 [Deltaproteobacteria bacterium]|nr:hypothetical protein [Deltaproteobacteria bacterium]
MLPTLVGHGREIHRVAHARLNINLRPFERPVKAEVRSLMEVGVRPEFHEVEVRPESLDVLVPCGNRDDPGWPSAAIPGDSAAVVTMTSASGVPVSRSGVVRRINMPGASGHGKLRQPVAQ